MVTNIGPTVYTVQQEKMRKQKVNEARLEEDKKNLRQALDDAKVRIPIAMQRNLRQRRCPICGSGFLLLYFQRPWHS
jgi:hypothetical protein